MCEGLEGETSPWLSCLLIDELQRRTINFLLANFCSNNILKHFNEPLAISIFQTEFFMRTVKKQNLAHSCVYSSSNRGGRQRRCSSVSRRGWRSRRRLLDAWRRFRFTTQASCAGQRKACHRRYRVIRENYLWGTVVNWTLWRCRDTLIHFLFCKKLSPYFYLSSIHG